ncbi:MAG: sugar kinase [Lachnospiraceae bacterium]|nr:sugar kinase [Lachnospiraceae bacterium]MCI8813635.1 sugar kinase [Lachnospiraceae bacterium]
MKVVAFGELLLRLAAPGYTKLFQKDSFDATFCGGEANVAVSLSIFGVDSTFVTKLPDSDVGYAAAHSLDYFKVDTSKIVYGDGRMGLYYLEKGASQRPSKVIYDRAYSAIAMAKRSEFDWDTIFNGAEWFHWTGINPALSDDLAMICEEACKVAKDKGLTISCDLNYRGKLWTPEKAQEVMKPLMKYVGVCICNEEDAEKVLGIKSEGTDIEAGKLSDAGYVHTAEMIYSQYGCKYIATTLRKSYSASRNGWRAMLYDTEALESYFSREYDIQLIDRVGGGDSFSAGLIYGIGTGMGCQGAIEFATAASCLKQTIEGDFNRASVKDVETLLKSGGNGRVQR